MQLQKAQIISVATGDFKTTLSFYTEVMGFRLIALHRDGTPGSIRAVLRIGAASDRTLFSLYYHPDIVKLPPVLDITEPRDPANTVTPGSLQHLAFTLPTLDDLEALNNRLRAAGVRRQMIWDIQRCSGAEALVHLG